MLGLWCMIPGVDGELEAAVPNGTAAADMSEAPPLPEEEVAADAPSGWAGWQPLPPAEGAEAEPGAGAAGTEGGPAQQTPANDAGRGSDEWDAEGTAEAEGGSGGGSGDDSDVDDDEVAEAQPDEEQETEEELLAQCALM